MFVPSLFSVTLPTAFFIPSLTAFCNLLSGATISPSWVLSPIITNCGLFFLTYPPLANFGTLLVLTFADPPKLNPRNTEPILLIASTNMFAISIILAMILFNINNTGDRIAINPRPRVPFKVSHCKENIRIWLAHSPLVLAKSPWANFNLSSTNW